MIPRRWHFQIKWTVYKISSAWSWKKKSKWKGAFKSSSISPSNCFSQRFGIWELLHLWCYSLLIIQALCLQTSVLTCTAEVSTGAFYHRGFPNQPGCLWRGLVSQPVSALATRLPPFSSTLLPQTFFINFEHCISICPTAFPWFFLSFSVLFSIQTAL